MLRGSLRRGPCTESSAQRLRKHALPRTLREASPVAPALPERRALSVKACQQSSAAPRRGECQTLSDEVSDCFAALQRITWHRVLSMPRRACPDWTTSRGLRLGTSPVELLRGDLQMKSRQIGSRTQSLVEP